MMRSWRAGYLGLARAGKLVERSRQLDALLADCTVCPHACRVDRRREIGTCATGAEALVASWQIHHGEEPAISCHRGSGTVFLANCNLSCAFCQNHDISQRPRDFIGKEVSADELAAIFLDLQDRVLFLFSRKPLLSRSYAEILFIDNICLPCRIVRW